MEGLANITESNYRWLIKRMKGDLSLDRSIKSEYPDLVDDYETIEIIKSELSREKEIYLFEKWVLPLLISLKSVLYGKNPTREISLILKKGGFLRVGEKWTLSDLEDLIEKKKNSFKQKVRSGTNRSYSTRGKEGIEKLKKGQKEGRKKAADKMTPEQIEKMKEIKRNSSIEGWRKNPDRGGAISEGKRRAKEKLTNEQLEERRILNIEKAKKINNSETKKLKTEKTRELTRISRCTMIYDILPSHTLTMQEVSKLCKEKFGFLPGKTRRLLQEKSMFKLERKRSTHTPSGVVIVLVTKIL